MAAGCSSDALNETGTSLSSRQIKIVATTGMVAELVERVGGERVDVETLMRPGSYPHVYRASPRDEQALADSDAVFYNGLNLEAKLGAVFDRLPARVHALAVTEGIDRARLLPGPAGGHDPHVWLDVGLWRQAAAQVRDDLSSLDRANAYIYDENAARYDRELLELDRWVRRRIAPVPAEDRELVTAHDAFRYFGRAYGFATRVKGSAPAIGGRLYSDWLGEPGTPAGTYAGMVRHNVEAMLAG